MLINSFLFCSVSSFSFCLSFVDCLTITNHPDNIIPMLHGCQPQNLRLFVGYAHEPLVHRLNLQCRGSCKLSIRQADKQQIFWLLLLFCTKYPSPPKQKFKTPHPTLILSPTKYHRAVYWHCYILMRQYRIRWTTHTIKGAQAWHNI